MRPCSREAGKNLGANHVEIERLDENYEYGTGFRIAILFVVNIDTRTLWLSANNSYKHVYLTHCLLLCATITRKHERVDLRS